MRRLSARTLGEVPANVQIPRYDRQGIRIGMAHIGVGAFHRCHQAEFTEDVLEQGFADWGVVGINLHPPSLKDALDPQDGLYSRTLRKGEHAETRILGCIRRLIDGAAAVDDAQAALADASIAAATMTVTEKGYCHIPATGTLDETHPDIVHDLRHPDRPRSAVGLIVAALDRRRKSHGTGLTLISCDNIPANGTVLRRVVSTFAAACDPQLAAWIDAEVRFPSTMVDRIVPATEASDLRRAAALCGLEDRAAVVGEPFRQWVIEGDFQGRRPPWDLAGAEFVTNVHGHELIKMRLLNAAQSAWAYFGALSNLDYTFEAARHPVLRPLVMQMLAEESAATVPSVPGMAPDIYIPMVLERVANPAIRHRNHQVATDGSQKIVQRILNPVRDRIAAGRDFSGLALVVGAWMAYLLVATPRFGSRWTVADPWYEDIARMAARRGDVASLVREIVGIQHIFGTDLQSDLFCEAVMPHVEGLLSGTPERYLALQRSQIAVA